MGRVALFIFLVSPLLLAFSHPLPTPHHSVSNGALSSYIVSGVSSVSGRGEILQGDASCDACRSFVFRLHQQAQSLPSDVNDDEKSTCPLSVLSHDLCESVWKRVENKATFFKAVREGKQCAHQICAPAFCASTRASCETCQHAVSKALGQFSAIGAEQHNKMVNSGVVKQWFQKQLGFCSNENAKRKMGSDLSVVLCSRNTSAEDNLVGKIQNLGDDEKDFSLEEASLKVCQIASSCTEADEEAKICIGSSSSTSSSLESVNHQPVRVLSGYESGSSCKDSAATNKAAVYKYKYVATNKVLVGADAAASEAVSSLEVHLSVSKVATLWKTGENVMKLEVESASALTMGADENKDKDAEDVTAWLVGENDIEEHESTESAAGGKKKRTIYFLQHPVSGAVSDRFISRSEDEAEDLSVEEKHGAGKFSLSHEREEDAVQVINSIIDMFHLRVNVRHGHIVPSFSIEEKDSASFASGSNVVVADYHVSADASSVSRKTSWSHQGLTMSSDKSVEIDAETHVIKQVLLRAKIVGGGRLSDDTEHDASTSNNSAKNQAGLRSFAMRGFEAAELTLVSSDVCREQATIANNIRKIDSISELVQPGEIIQQLVLTSTDPVESHPSSFFINPIDAATAATSASSEDLALIPIIEKAFAATQDSNIVDEALLVRLLRADKSGIVAHMLGGRLLKKDPSTPSLSTANTEAIVRALISTGDDNGAVQSVLLEFFESSMVYPANLKQRALASLVSYFRLTRALHAWIDSRVDSENDLAVALSVLSAFAGRSGDVESVQRCESIATNLLASTNDEEKLRLALLILGNLGGRQQLSKIRDALQQQASSVLVREQAVISLRRIPGVDVTELIKDHFFTESNAAVRLACLSVLANDRAAVVSKSFWLNFARDLKHHALNSTATTKTGGDKLVIPALSAAVAQRLFEILRDRTGSEIEFAAEPTSRDAFFDLEDIRGANSRSLEEKSSDDKHDEHDDDDDEIDALTMIELGKMDAITKKKQSSSPSSSLVHHLEQSRSIGFGAKSLRATVDGSIVGDLSFSSSNAAVLSSSDVHAQASMGMSLPVLDNGRDHLQLFSVSAHVLAQSPSTSVTHSGLFVFGFQLAVPALLQSSPDSDVDKDETDSLVCDGENIRPTPALFKGGSLPFSLSRTLRIGSLEVQVGASMDVDSGVVLHSCGSGKQMVVAGLVPRAHVAAFVAIRSVVAGAGGAGLATTVFDGDLVLTAASSSSNSSPSVASVSSAPGLCPNGKGTEDRLAIHINGRQLPSRLFAFAAQSATSSGSSSSSVLPTEVAATCFPRSACDSGKEQSKKNVFVLYSRCGCGSELQHQQAEEKGGCIASATQAAGKKINRSIARFPSLSDLGLFGAEATADLEEGDEYYYYSSAAHNDREPGDEHDTIPLDVHVIDIGAGHSISQQNQRFSSDMFAHDQEGRTQSESRREFTETEGAFVDASNKIHRTFSAGAKRLLMKLGKVAAPSRIEARDFYRREAATSQRLSRGVRKEIDETFGRTQRDSDRVERAARRDARDVEQDISGARADEKLVDEEDRFRSGEKRLRKDGSNVLAGFEREEQRARDRRLEREEARRSGALHQNIGQESEDSFVKNLFGRERRVMREGFDSRSDALQQRSKRSFIRRRSARGERARSMSSSLRRILSRRRESARRRRELQADDARLKKNLNAGASERRALKAIGKRVRSEAKTLSKDSRKIDSTLKSRISRQKRSGEERREASGVRKLIRRENKQAGGAEASKITKALRKGDRALRGQERRETRSQKKAISSIGRQQRERRRVRRVANSENRDAAKVEKTLRRGSKSEGSLISRDREILNVDRHAEREKRAISRAGRSAKRDERRLASQFARDDRRTERRMDSSAKSYRRTERKSNDKLKNVVRRVAKGTRKSLKRDEEIAKARYHHEQADLKRSKLMELLQHPSLSADAANHVHAAVKRLVSRALRLGLPLEGQVDLETEESEEMPASWLKTERKRVLRQFAARAASLYSGAEKMYKRDKEMDEDIAKVLVRARATWEQAYKYFAEFAKYRNAARDVLKNVRAGVHEFRVYSQRAAGNARFADNTLRSVEESKAAVDKLSGETSGMLSRFSRAGDKMREWRNEMNAHKAAVNQAKAKLDTHEAQKKHIAEATAAAAGTPTLF